MSVTTTVAVTEIVGFEEGVKGEMREVGEVGEKELEELARGFWRSARRGEREVHEGFHRGHHMSAEVAK